MYNTSISHHHNLALRQDKSFIRGTQGFKKEWNIVSRRFWIELEKSTLPGDVQERLYINQRAGYIYCKRGFKGPGRGSVHCTSLHKEGINRSCEEFLC